MKFIVIGITDNPQPWFPPEVLTIVKNGKVFSGGKRHHEIVAPLLPEGAEWIDITVPLDAVFEQFCCLGDKTEGCPVVVFASGDPLFFGFANTIKRKMPEAEIAVYPTFNSLQMLAHRLVLPYHDMRIVSLTGRPWQEFDRALIERAVKIGVLTDREHTPAAIARRMLDYGYTAYEMHIGEHLGNPTEEKVTTLTLEEAANKDFAMPNCVILHSIVGEASQLCLVGEASQLCRPVVGEASKLCSPVVGEASKLCLVGEASKLCIVGEASKLCIVGEASKLCLVGEASKLCLVGEASQLCRPVVGEATQLCRPVVGEASQLCPCPKDAAAKLGSFTHYGIPDSTFTLLDGREKMITKMPIRLLTLQALDLPRRRVFWDIGFCTGSVSIEARLLFPHLHIVAFEIRPECEAIIRENARRHGAPGINVHMGDFRSVCCDYIATSRTAPDAVFIGGHGGHLKEIMAKVFTVLAPGGVIVMNSVKAPKVTTDSRQLWDEACQELGLQQEPPLHIQLNDNHPITILKCKR